MPVIAVRDIKKSFVERLLFDGVTFEIGEKDRIGLVGVNGCGKTTLFRILTGEEERDGGDIYKSRDARIVTMSQFIEDTALTVYEATIRAYQPLIDMEASLGQMERELSRAQGEELTKLIERHSALLERFEREGGLTYKSRARSTLLGLGFDEKELTKPLSDMSGGQRNKEQLARVLLSGAELLLLDEPTNHLDLDSIMWLEDFLKAYPGAFIVISHDRYFLDAVTNRTMELKNTRFYMTDGNYTRHTELMEDEQEALRRKYVRTQREIKRIERIVEQQRRWGQEHNFITAASKQKQADKLRTTLVSPERDTSSIHFRFRADAVSGNDVIIAEGLSKSYDKSVFKNVDLLVKKGERVFLLGPNGCGKTTLLRIVLGKERPDAGVCHLGANVHPGYYEQNAMGLHPELTAVEEIRESYPRMSDTEIRTALGAFLFRGDDVFKELSLLSGGETARIQLLKLMLSKSNLLLLDEPTNHLDIDSREALERALEDYDGSMLIVTHDRYLVEKLADRVLEMRPDGVDEYLGGYADYLEQKTLRAEERAAAKPPAHSAFAEDYKAKKERQSAINRARGEAKRDEERVARAEEELRAIEARLASPEVATDYKKAAEEAERAERKHAEIEALYKAWDEAQRALELLGGEKTGET